MSSSNNCITYCCIIFLSIILLITVVMISASLKGLDYFEVRYTVVVIFNKYICNGVVFIWEFQEIGCQNYTIDTTANNYRNYFEIIIQRNSRINRKGPFNLNISFNNHYERVPHLIVSHCILTRIIIQDYLIIS